MTGGQLSAMYKQNIYINVILSYTVAPGKLYLQRTCRVENPDSLYGDSRQDDCKPQLA